RVQHTRADAMARGRWPPAPAIASPVDAARTRGRPLVRNMSIAAPFLVFLLIGGFAAYHRLRLATWTALTAAGLLACWLLGASGGATVVAALPTALVAVPRLLPQIRLNTITRPLLDFYTKILPPLSETERVALEAGTVGFEGELFSGRPDWDALLRQPPAALSADEQAFLDGP